MDRENALRMLFPQIDARLIKATVLEGDDMDSAVDFLIKEGMQSNEPKPDGISSLASDYVRVDDTLMMPGAKKHHVTLDKDDEYLTDFSCDDKHEESIVWKGGLRTGVFEGPQILNPSEGRGLDDFDDLNSLREQAIVPGNDRIEWWAATWQNMAGSREDEDVVNSSSICSVLTDSNAQDESGSGYLHGPIVDADLSFTGSTQSLLLEKANSSSWATVSGIKEFHKGCKSLVERDLPRSQESFEVFHPVSLPEGERPVTSSSDKLCQPTKGYISDDDSKISSGQSVNVKCIWEDCVAQETILESSRYNIDTEDLDKLVSEAKCCKENMRKDMEDIYFLRQKAEQEELAAQHAKAEATRGGLEIFLEVEDVRQHVSRERAEYEMRAAEVYGEKSVLSMEARELKSRLLETQAEQTKALFLLDAIRCTLSACLEKASQEKHSAIEETKVKVKNAKELLAIEQTSAQKLMEGIKALEAEAETCKKLREFLVERGNIVDSLQGEMAVLCEDVLKFKEQVDEGIPLSGSRSLSWSRVSHLTEQFSPSNDNKDCRSSKCLLLESSGCIKSISSTSILTLSSVTSELPKSVQPIGCDLHSQYFSPGSSIADKSDQGSCKKIVKEKIMGGQEVEEIVEVLVTTANKGCEDGMEAQQKQEENSHLASSSVLVLEEERVL